MYKQEAARVLAWQARLTWAVEWELLIYIMAHISCQLSSHEDHLEFAWINMNSRRKSLAIVAQPMPSQDHPLLAAPLATTYHSQQDCQLESCCLLYT